jgi:hypothetical protein
VISKQLIMSMEHKFTITGIFGHESGTFELQDPIFPFITWSITVNTEGLGTDYFAIHTKFADGKQPSKLEVHITRNGTHSSWDFSAGGIYRCGKSKLYYGIHLEIRELHFTMSI